MRFLMPNVRCHLPPLAFGADPASAGSVPKVPQAWWLGAQLRSAILFAMRVENTITPYLVLICAKLH